MWVPFDSLYVVHARHLVQFFSLLISVGSHVVVVHWSLAEISLPCTVGKI